MQIINKSSIKKSLTYTWYLYPISAALLALLWLWSFQAYHQPSAHQKLNVFFATDIKNEGFIKDILKKYDPENLRQVNPSYSLPDGVGYYQKLKIAINSADILVLTQNSFESYKDSYGTFFVKVTDYVKEKCQITDNQVFNDYGILLKNGSDDCYLSQYMDFRPNENYYIALSVTSKNLGSALDEKNAYYDNALTFVHYLIEGV